MGTILEELKERAEAAKLRFQVAQAEYQAAQIAVNTWNAAVVIETKAEEARLAASQQNQMTIPGLPERPISTTEIADVVDGESQSEGDPINKTELVRELLRTKPNGLSAADVWKSVREQISSRAYLYSILKRLRDKDEVVLRRSGKYVLKPKPVELAANNVEMEVIQEAAASASSLEGN